MALVAYEGSSSESEDEPSVSFKPLTELPKPKNLNGTHDEEPNILKALPTPKSAASSGIEEDDDEFLRKKETPSEKPPLNKPNKRVPAKILLPSLASFEKEEEEERRPRFEPPNKSTGLLSILPRPRGGTLNVNLKPSTQLVPRVLNQPKSKPSKPIQSKPKPVKVAPDIKQLAAYGSSGESDGSDGEDQPGEVDFFSLTRKEELPELNPDELVNGDLFPVQTIDSDILHSDNVNFPQQESETSIRTAEDIAVAEPSNDYVELGEEAVRALCSNRERRKGHAVQFIDIDQNEMLPDRREWMTKALTENPSRGLSTGKRPGDGPGGVSKRKHQITYLAQQARANEQELQNRWANNRMTRKQTQSKYGF